MVMRIKKCLQINEKGHNPKNMEADQGKLVEQLRIATKLKKNLKEQSQHSGFSVLLLLLVYCVVVICFQSVLAQCCSHFHR